MTASRLIERLHRPFGRWLSGTPIWEFDFDICCLLDGCRVDTFREVYPNASSYWSVGSTSSEWIEYTFSEVDTDTIAYLSANPFSHKADPDSFAFFRQERVQETGYGIETVPPAVLMEQATTLWNERQKHGIEKLIIHFMQPHVPFRSQPEWFEEFGNSKVWGSRRWGDVGGTIPRDKWLAAYRDNLSWVLDTGVKPLANRVDATIGITSDHGNALGEFGIYGHPRSVAVPTTRKVPWMKIEGENNHDTTIGGKISESNLDSSERDAQLEALGYI